MARFLFAATPAAGHVNPALPIVRALTGAGHQVLLTSGPGFAGTAAAAGARFVPLPPDASIDASTLDERYPAREKLTGARLIRHDLVHFFTAPPPRRPGTSSDCWRPSRPTCWSRTPASSAPG